jgi:RpiR family transcriptional regulator, carbohydrate utilization regulator
MSATMLKAGDCAVIISNSGRSRDLLDVADIARKKGATVIAITASGSPLAREAQSGPHHILLAADHPEDADRYSPMVSRLLHLLIVDVLTTGVALRLGSAALRPMLQEIKRNLRVRRYAAPERAVDRADEASADSQAYGAAVEPEPAPVVKPAGAKPRSPNKSATP